MCIYWRFVLVVGTGALLALGCAEATKAAQSLAVDGGTRQLPDIEGRVINQPPSAGGGEPSGDSDGLNPPSESDAAMFWGADQGRPAGACAEGERRACTFEACENGLRICHDGVFGSCGPSPELCNDLDDDCDGQIDETFPSKGQVCMAEGACAGDRRFVCDGEGGLKCEAPEGSGSPEVCDALDNDCDGQFDEDFPGEQCCGRDADCALGEQCDATGHCETDPNAEPPVDPGDPFLPGFGAPIVPQGSACNGAIDIPGPGDYPGVTAGNGDSGLCTFFDSGGGEVAFTLTRAADTLVRLVAMGDFLVDTVLYIRTDCRDPFSEIDCSDDADFLDTTAELVLDARAGQTYTIFVDTWDSGGEFVLHVEERAPGPPLDPPLDPPPGPPGVACELPTPLVEGENLGDTRGGSDELSGDCANTGGGREEVFVLRVDVVTRVELNLTADRWDSVLYVGELCAGGMEVACNDDVSPGDQNSRVRFEALPGRDYFVVVDGFGGDGGPFSLSYRTFGRSICEAGPMACPLGESCFGHVCQSLPEGACSAAEPLVFGWPVSGNTMGGTAAFELNCNLGPSAERIYAFIPEVDGRVRVHTEGSIIDTVIGVLDGCGDPLVAIRCNDDFAVASASQIAFEATAGQLYYVIVEGFAGGLGEFTLTVE